MNISLSIRLIDSGTSLIDSNEGMSIQKCAQNSVSQQALIKA